MAVRWSTSGGLAAEEVVAGSARGRGPGGAETRPRPGGARGGGPGALGSTKNNTKLICSFTHLLLLRKLF